MAYSAQPTPAAPALYLGVAMAGSICQDWAAVVVTLTLACTPGFPMEAMVTIVDCCSPVRAVDGTLTCRSAAAVPQGSSVPVRARLLWVVASTRRDAQPEAATDRV